MNLSSKKMIEGLFYVLGYYVLYLFAQKINSAEVNPTQEVK